MSETLNQVEEAEHWRIGVGQLPEYLEFWRNNPDYRLYGLYTQLGEQSLCGYFFVRPDAHIGDRDVMRICAVPHVSTYYGYTSFQRSHPDLGLPDAVQGEENEAMAA